MQEPQRLLKTPVCKMISVLLKSGARLKRYRSSRLLTCKTMYDLKPT